MFSFWYPEVFNSLRQKFIQEIQKQKIEAHCQNSLPLLMESDSAIHFIEAIDVLMNLYYWTDHAEDVTLLLEEAVACYVDHDYTRLQPMEMIICHLFTHAHAKAQQDLHLLQYVTCTTIGISLLYQPTHMPLAHCFMLYRGLAGLWNNYISRKEEFREQLHSFVETISSHKASDEDREALTPSQSVDNFFSPS